MPGVAIPLCLFLVHRHPQPVDDCPCFEDAIAFVSVLMGEYVLRWFMFRYGYDESFFVGVMPGSSWATYTDMLAWFSVAAIKMILGEYSLMFSLHRTNQIKYVYPIVCNGIQVF